MRNVLHYVSLCFFSAVLISCNIERDHADAVILAARVHSQMQTEDYLAIYRESAPRFKNVGSESQFVSMMQDFRRQIGLLKGASEIAYQASVSSGVGKIHVLTFHLEFEHGRFIEKLSFIRSDDGQMRLWKLDYPDPVKSVTPQ
jgi:Protein of unknown function (DUF4019)